MGILYIVSTPIGNLEDITIRAIKTLFSVDAILCEDTRRTGLLIDGLIDRYGEQFDASSEHKPKLIAYYDEIEKKRLPEMIERLEAGETLALVSDAGTPLISDPGFTLVKECVRRGINVVSVPGPSAMLTALTSCGLPVDKFMFLGYPPERKSNRMKLFSSLPKETTLIFYCAPHKFTQTLIEMQDVLGDIKVTICRELTKIHEEIWHGSISKAEQYFVKPKGEFVVLFNIPQV